VELPSLFRYVRRRAGAACGDRELERGFPIGER
jgi:hypothetical protein